MITTKLGLGSVHLEETEMGFIKKMLWKAHKKKVQKAHNQSPPCAYCGRRNVHTSECPWNPKRKS